RKYQRDAVARDRKRRRDAEHRLARRPRRQPVDLGADHAVEEIGRLFWKIDRAKQHMIRSHEDVYAAAAERRAPCGARRRLHAAMIEVEREWRQHGALSRRA